MAEPLDGVDNEPRGTPFNPDTDVVPPGKVVRQVGNGDVLLSELFDEDDDPYPGQADVHGDPQLAAGPPNLVPGALARTTSRRATFTSRVVAQQRGLQGYYTSQLRKARIARVVVIVTAGSVPVVVSVGGVPSWVVGAMGATAAATEAFSQLFRWRESAVSAHRSANDLARQLVRLQQRAAPYDGPTDDAFAAFVESVLRIDDQTSQKFSDLWSKDGSYDVRRS
jgi:Protein of unknown function (DUF4231)